MKFFNFVWNVIGLLVASQYAYWGTMFAGAWLNLTAAPSVSQDWLALGMFGAMFTAIEQLRLTRT